LVSYGALAEGVMAGDASVVESEVNKALNEGAEARDILVQGLIGSMSIVGERFRNGDMFLPEVLMLASAMNKGLDIIRPLLAKSGQSSLAKVIMGTVEGDIHDIGKRIVSLLLQGNGFEVIDLGVDIKGEAFIQAVEEHKPDILGMSALLTTTMPNMGKVIDLLKEKGLREKIKVMVGGAPVNEEFAKSIGADGYAPEAGSAAELVKKLVAS
jgi:5-methyltetrahydrofolate--homocysteine methyltransferase